MNGIKTMAGSSAALGLSAQYKNKYKIFNYTNKHDYPRDRLLKISRYHMYIISKSK